jgi:hypothetical protein
MKLLDEPTTDLSKKMRMIDYALNLATLLFYVGSLMRRRRISLIWRTADFIDADETGAKVADVVNDPGLIE